MQTLLVAFYQTMRQPLRVRAIQCLTLLAVQFFNCPQGKTWVYVYDVLAIPTAQALQDPVALGHLIRYDLHCQIVEVMGHHVDCDSEEWPPPPPPDHLDPVFEASPTVLVLHPGDDVPGEDEEVWWRAVDLIRSRFGGSFVAAQPNWGVDDETLGFPFLIDDPEFTNGHQDYLRLMNVPAALDALYQITEPHGPVLFEVPPRDGPIWFRHAGNRVNVAVMDSGCAILADELPIENVFQPGVVGPGFDTTTRIRGVNAGERDWTPIDESENSHGTNSCSVLAARTRNRTKMVSPAGASALALSKP